MSRNGDIQFFPGKLTFAPPCTGSMNNARQWHTASILTDGKVLVTGGISGTSLLNSAELYDQSTGTWTNTDKMNDGRYQHTSSVLTGGKVLVTGGAYYGTLNTTELYDPSARVWTITLSSSFD